MSQYQPPQSPIGKPSRSHEPIAVENLVRAPATALMVVALISASLLSLAFCFDIFLLVSGLANEIERPNTPLSRSNAIMIRVVLGLILIVINSYVVYGALKMKRLENYSAARKAAIISVIPCIAPCYILGVPFGIWALVTLGKPGVKESFDS